MAPQQRERRGYYELGTQAVRGRFDAYHETRHPAIEHKLSRPRPATRPHPHNVNWHRTTEQQRKANRTNASRSTGPKSESGKKSSSSSSLIHGLYAHGATAIPRGLFQEDQSEIDDFVNSIAESLLPRDEIEAAQAMRIAHCYLQLRRLSRFEAEAMVATMPRESTTDRFQRDELELPSPTPDSERVTRAIFLLGSALETASRIDARIATSLDQALLVLLSYESAPSQSRYQTRLRWLQADELVALRSDWCLAARPAGPAWRFRRRCPAPPRSLAGRPEPEPSERSRTGVGRRTGPAALHPVSPGYRQCNGTTRSRYRPQLPKGSVRRCDHCRTCTRRRSAADMSSC